jgi:hypothetical protein
MIYRESDLLVGTNFRGFYKMHWSMGSWIHGFKHYRQHSMGKLYFVEFEFNFRGLSEPRNPRKLEAHD